MKALLLLTNGQRKKYLWFGKGDINKRGPDRFHSRTCVQTEWSVEPHRMTRSVSNLTPGKLLSLADILTFFSSFSVLERGGGEGEKEKEKKKERTTFYFTAPNPP